MKKVFSVFLIFAMVFSLLTACVDNPTPTESTEEMSEPDMNITPKFPAKDEPLNILMIGSSFCYYYVEELYGMLTAAGYKDVNVCNVYYSGGTLAQHWNWWKLAESNYTFYTTNARGRVNSGEKVSLDFCLNQRDWDVISLQEGTSQIYKPGAENHLSETKQYWSELYDYMMKRFPNVRFLWHQPWSRQQGYVQASDPSSQPMTAERQVLCQEQIELFAKAVCQHYDGKVQRVNTGNAWQIIRQKYNYDEMCARLASNNGAGDYNHDGDIGGGQYLNACVWFEVITGESCIGNTYVPTYNSNIILTDELQSKLRVDVSGSTFSLKPELIDIIQKSAHEAVAQLGLEIAE